MYNSKEKCKEIAQKFKQICEDRGTTPYKIAKKAGLSSSTVSGFLNGRTNPRIDTMMILCNQLGVSITDFFDERELAKLQDQRGSKFDRSLSKAGDSEEGITFHLFKNACTV